MIRKHKIFSAVFIAIVSLCLANVFARNLQKSADRQALVREVRVALKAGDFEKAGAGIQAFERANQRGFFNRLSQELVEAMSKSPKVEAKPAEVSTQELEKATRQAEKAAQEAEKSRLIAQEKTEKAKKEAAEAREAKEKAEKAAQERLEADRKVKEAEAQKKRADQEAAQKAAADRRAQEEAKKAELAKQEAERQAKKEVEEQKKREEQERARKKAEEEKQAQEAAAQSEKKKLEADKKAKEAAEKVRRAQEEADRKAKQEEQAVEQAKKEAEEAKRVEQERQAAQKAREDAEKENKRAEQERLEAERRVKEEEDQRSRAEQKAAHKIEEVRRAQEKKIRGSETKALEYNNEIQELAKTSNEIRNQTEVAFNAYNASDKTEADEKKVTNLIGLYIANLQKDLRRAQSLGESIRTRAVSLSSETLNKINEQASQGIAVIAKNLREVIEFQKRTESGAIQLEANEPLDPKDFAKALKATEERNVFLRESLSVRRGHVQDEDDDEEARWNSKSLSDVLRKINQPGTIKRVVNTFRAIIMDISNPQMLLGTVSINDRDDKINVGLIQVPPRPPLDITKRFNTLQDQLKEKNVTEAMIVENFKTIKETIKNSGLDNVDKIAAVAEFLENNFGALLQEYRDTEKKLSSKDSAYDDLGGLE